MKAVLRRIRISPIKANLVAGMVRGKSVKEALNILKFVPQKGAKILYKVIHSAAYNAKNNFNQDIDDLVIIRILVTKGPMYKRTLPVSRGRSHPILKRTSHITVEVGMPEKDGSVAPKPISAKEVKSEKMESAPVKDDGVKVKKVVKKKTVSKNEESDKKEKKVKKSK